MFQSAYFDLCTPRLSPLALSFLRANFFLYRTHLKQAGRHSLASLSPTPFLPLASLLFSEKRPGDLPCRQLLVELLQAVFEVAPSGLGVQPIGRKCADWEGAGVVKLEREEGSGSGGVRRYTRPIKGGEDDAEGGWASLSPERKTEIHRFVYSLMQGPPNEKEEAKVEFIQQAHQERRFKVWITELSDCVRDYFWWVFSLLSSRFNRAWRPWDNANRPSFATETGSSVTRKTSSGPSSKSTRPRLRRPKSPRG